MGVVYHATYDSNGNITKMYPEYSMDRIREFGLPVSERRWYKNLYGNNSDAYLEPIGELVPITNTQAAARLMP